MNKQQLLDKMSEIHDSIVDTRRGVHELIDELREIESMFDDLPGDISEIEEDKKEKE